MHASEIDGDKANAETYIQAIMRFKREGKLYDLVGCGRYLDKLERRQGEWRIAARVVLGDWDKVDEVEGTGRRRTRRQGDPRPAE